MAIRGNLSHRTDSNMSIDDIISEIRSEREILIRNKETKISKFSKMLEEDVFEIPSDWKWVALGDLCILLSRGKSPKYSDVKKYPVFAQKCNQPQHLALEKALFLDETTLDKWPEYFKLRDADVVINSTGTGTVGRVGYFTSESLDPKYEFIVPDSHVTVVRVGNNIISKYIYYAMRTKSIQTIMEKTFRGSTNQKEFYIDSVYSIPIPLPPTEEQKEIVSILDKVHEQLDIIDTLQQQYESDLSVLKGKIIDAGIRGKLTEQLPEDGDAETLYSQIQEEKEKLIKEGKIKKSKPLPEIDVDEIPFEIPKNWKWVRLGDVVSKISSGNTPAGGKKSDAYVEQGFCFFREQNIYDDGIHEEGMVYISKELLDKRSNSTVLPKDILLNITGGSIGRCAIIPDDFSKGSINQHILIIRMIDERLRYYIHHCLCSPFMQKYIKGNAVGDKDGFSGGRCKNMLIPLPPILEQERICSITNVILEQM